MPQITSLRRLLMNHPPPLLTLLKPSSVLPILSKSSRIHQPLRAFSHFTVFCSSSRRRRNSSTPLNFRSRGKASVAERKEGGDKKENVMEESELPGFNKRRAEGRDKNDMPRKLARNTRKPNPVSTICYVQILGTGLDTQDTSPSVLLFFDQQRFIFNAGEGLQRFCTEHKIKLSKIDHIFLSRVCSETAGGLPGLLLTLAGIGEEGLAVNLWGHSDLNLLISAMKSFIPNAAMVHTRSFGSSPSCEGKDNSDLKKFTKAIELINDEVVSISAILLRPCYSNMTSLGQQVQMFPGSPEVGPGEDGYQISKSKVLSGEDGTMLKSGDISVIYVCELAEIKGKFYPDKAKALGLRPGPKYRELQLGNSVKSDQQNIMVHPNDVMDPSVPGPIVLLVDCPTLSHFQCLLSADSLNVYYTDNVGNQSENAKTVNCVIHLSPLYVTSTLDYQSWMKRFGGAQHIFAGHEPKNAGIPILKSSARISARLNYLCPQFFPSSGFWPLQGINNLPLKSNHPSEGLHGTSAENLLKFRLRPHKDLGVDKSEIPTSREHADIIDELLTEIPDIVDAAESVRQLRPDVHKIEEPWLNDSGLPSCLEDISREDMEIILLGTGSSQPSKYRNVTSIYINLFFKGSMLLDCGEGTLGQLKRRFGVEGADDAVRKLRCIWISHIHADHHTGLARILALRCKLFKGIPHEPILVVGPRQLKRFLDAYQRLEDLDMQFLDCKHTTKASWDNFQSSLESNIGLSLAGDSTDSQNTNMKTNITDIEGTLFAQEGRMQSYWKRPGSPIDHGAAFPILKILKDVLHEAGLEALISFPVIHCPQAFGVVLKAAKRTNNVGKVIPGWKLVYSGDTRPCLELIEASRGATVLIHEATFEDGLVEEAIAKNHSTTKEAIEVGDSAGVYRTILTHFSQRYPKIPVFDESHMHSTCVGFDMMSVNMADLPLLPKVLPYLKLLFRDEMGLDESDDVVDAAAAAK